MSVNNNLLTILLHHGGGNAAFFDPVGSGPDGALAGHANITTTQRCMNARASSLAESMRQTRERRVNRVEHVDQATAQIG